MKKGLLAGLLALGLLGTSCLGPNKAFNSIHDWNEGVSDNKWTNEFVHLAFWIIPVYPVSLLADIVVFNSIEWWGGDNPIGD